VALLAACGLGPPRVAAPLQVTASLQAQSAEGYLRALSPRPFRFPADHGAHLGFRTEWWYVTGHLEGPPGDRFGFQLTFFRNSLSPPGAAPPRSSRWATDQAFLAHFAVTDGPGGRFLAFERLARGALGLAGATVADTVGEDAVDEEPYRVSVGGWRLEGPAPGEVFPLLLAAAVGEPPVALELTLEPVKPVVLQGERGLSRKGPQPGNASYYYSLPRLRATGELVLAGTARPVTGSAWLDREWSTSSLPAGTVGWDWVALQLDDGRELMLYRLRREDGSATPQSRATLIAPDGGSRELPWEDLELAATGRFKSPRTGVTYPSGWRLRVPAEGLDLTLLPWLPDQELDLSFRYWEGAVDVRGRGPTGPLAGRGYVELTGYGEER
jgi:predicted secreted hydrolase